MPDLTAATWFPVLTLLIGYGTKSLTDLAQHRRIAKRERDAREAARKEKLFERRVDFQRETLLELQESIIQLARATTVAEHQDDIAFRATGNWQRQLLPDELDETLRLAQARTSILSVRIRDDAARDLVMKFKSHCAAAGGSATRQESEHAMKCMSRAFEQVNHRIGELLRGLNDIDSQA